MGDVEQRAFEHWTTGIPLDMIDDTKTTEMRVPMGPAAATSLSCRLPGAVLVSCPIARPSRVSTASSTSHSTLDDYEYCWIPHPVYGSSTHLIPTAMLLVRLMR